jgi:hypothetical protein
MVTQRLAGSTSGIASTPRPLEKSGAHEIGQDLRAHLRFHTARALDERYRQLTRRRVQVRGAYPVEDSLIHAIDIRSPALLRTVRYTTQ